MGGPYVRGVYRFTSAHHRPEGPGHVPPRVGIVEPVLPENDQGGRGAQAGHHLGDALPVVVNLPPLAAARFAHGAADDPLPGHRLGMGAVFQVAQPRNAGLSSVRVAPLRVMGRVSRWGTWRAVVTVSPPVSRQPRME